MIKYIASTVFGGFVGVFLGYFIRLFIEHRLAIDRIKENIKITEFNKAASKLRASFAPQLAYLKGLRSTEGSNGGIEETRDYLYAAFIQFHAAELCKFRFYVNGKDVPAYDKECDGYEAHLYPGFTVDVKNQSPQEYFIDQINSLLNFAK